MYSKPLLALTLIVGLFTALAPNATAQRPLRTFAVTTEEPEPEPMSYTVEFFYSYSTQSPKGFTDLEFYFNSYDTNLYMWKSGFKIVWNPKALKFNSFRSEENLLYENLSEFTPQYGLSINTEFEKSEDSVIIVNANPVRLDKKTQLFRTYYIGTVRFKDVNEHQSYNFRFEPFGAHFYSASGVRVSDIINYEIQEYESDFEGGEGS